MNRRAFVQSLCAGLGAVGLQDMLRAETGGPHFAPRAKHIISLFMTGGPSQLDMFDPKPALVKYAGQRPPSVDLRTERVTGGLLPSPFKFKKYGRNGVEVSELLPRIASVIDDVCVVKSVYTFNPTHTPARSLIHSGNISATRPSMGAWISYGLGTENANLPRVCCFQRRAERVVVAVRIFACRAPGHADCEGGIDAGSDDSIPAEFGARSGGAAAAT
jgi:hypothetical protein